MTHWFDESRDQHEFVTVRTLWVTIALSVLVHLFALVFVLEQTHLLTPSDEQPDLASERLQVRLAATPATPAPAAVPSPAPPREIVALPKPPARPPRPAEHKEQPPEVIASTTPKPALPAPPVPAPARPSPPVESDLWAYMQARRRERGASEAPAVDSQSPEPNVNLAANLPTPATGVATPDPRRGGGIFEIKSTRYDDSSFLFYGWNKDMGRRTPQLIEVRKGDNSDMCIAIVRRMISIIREHEKGDFVWESGRRGDKVWLSARPADNAALEDYLMRDFRDDCARSR